MTVLTSVELDHLCTEYTWHDERRDRAGAYFNKGDDLAWLGSPTVLYAEDFSVPETKPAWKGEQEVTLNLDDLVKTAGFLKDRDLAEQLLQKGGVVQHFQDSDRTFVILLWLGRTEEEVEKLVLLREDEFKAAGAVDALKSAVNDLKRILGEDRARALFEEAISS